MVSSKNFLCMQALACLALFPLSIKSLSGQEFTDDENVEIEGTNGEDLSEIEIEGEEPQAPSTIPSNKPIQKDALNPYIVEKIQINEEDNKSNNIEKLTTFFKTSLHLFEEYKKKFENKMLLSKKNDIIGTLKDAGLSFDQRVHIWNLIEKQESVSFVIELNKILAIRSLQSVLNCILNNINKVNVEMHSSDEGFLVKQDQPSTFFRIPSEALKYAEEFSNSIIDITTPTSANQSYTTYTIEVKDKKITYSYTISLQKDSKKQDILKELKFAFSNGHLLPKKVEDRISQEGDGVISTKLGEESKAPLQHRYFVQTEDGYQLVNSKEKYDLALLAKQFIPKKKKKKIN